MQIILIYGNQHVLTGLVAASSYEKEGEIKTLILYPQRKVLLEYYNKFVKHCEKLVKGYPVDFYPMSDEQWNSFVKEKKLINFLPANEQPKRIFFPHNLEIDALVVLRKSFPKSDFVCFGDGFGTVFTALSYKSSKNQGRYRLVWWFCNKIKFMHKMSFIKKYFLILPVNHSGSKKLIKNREIPSKMQVLQVIEDLCGDIKNEMKRFVLREIDSSSVILCLENYYEAGLLSKESEVELFAEIVNSYDLNEKKIFIKSHPLQQNSRLYPLQRALEQHMVKPLPPYLDETPLELWPLSLFKGQIVGTGTFALSLKYLYEIEVLNPLNNRLIEKYFYPEFWNLIKADQKLVSKPVSALETWDGKSVLYQHG